MCCRVLGRVARAAQRAACTTVGTPLPRAAPALAARRCPWPQVTGAFESLRLRSVKKQEVDRWVGGVPAAPSPRYAWRSAAPLHLPAVLPAALCPAGGGASGQLALPCCLGRPPRSASVPPAPCRAPVGRWCRWRETRQCLKWGPPAARWSGSGAPPSSAPPSLSQASTSTSSRVRACAGVAAPGALRAGQPALAPPCPPACMPARPPVPNPLPPAGRDADDKTQGGHVLESVLLEGTAEIMVRQRWHPAGAHAR